jgi:hypothetical protein
MERKSCYLHKKKLEIALRIITLCKKTLFHVLKVIIYFNSVIRHYKATCNNIETELKINKSKFMGIQIRASIQNHV